MVQRSRNRGQPPQHRAPMLQRPRIRLRRAWARQSVPSSSERPLDSPSRSRCRRTEARRTARIGSSSMIGAHRVWRTGRKYQFLSTIGAAKKQKLSTAAEPKEWPADITWARRMPAPCGQRSGPMVYAGLQGGLGRFRSRSRADFRCPSTRRHGAPGTTNSRLALQSRSRQGRPGLRSARASCSASRLYSQRPSLGDMSRSPGTTRECAPHTVARDSVERPTAES
jgi:hypothetical protein